MTAAILEQLRRSPRIAVTAHDRPDGDALGSALGLVRILRAAGYTACAIGCRPVPERYAFLLAQDVFLPEDTVPATVGDVLVVLDTGMAERSTPAMNALRTGCPIVNIDHHGSNTAFGTVNWIDAHRSSTAEMVEELAREAGWRIDQSAAEALYAGLATDTGRFSFENTTPESLRCAARLVECGVVPYTLIRQLYETVPAAEMRMSGRALSNLELHFDGAVAMVSLSREDYAAEKCGPDMSGEVINFPRRIAGVAVALFLYEAPGSMETKISIRTEAPLDAVQLAKAFGGGGHSRAAGGSCTGRIPEARTAVLAEIRRLWSTALHKTSDGDLSHG